VLLDPIQIIMNDQDYLLVLKQLLLRSYNLLNKNLLNHECTKMLRKLYLLTNHLQQSKRMVIIKDLTNLQIQNGLDVTSHQRHRTMYVFLDMMKLNRMRYHTRLVPEPYVIVSYHTALPQLCMLIFQKISLFSSTLWSLIPTWGLFFRSWLSASF
jgi:hypothetical protein